MQALGMIEVIGYPPAIEAADAALKAANVTLLCIAKADAGIMTVELTGEVGAVTSAVDAGAEAAKRVGTLRAKHVIPRVDQELLGTMIFPAKKVEPQEATQVSTSGTDSSQSSESSENSSNIESVTREESETKQYSLAELSKLSNSNLKSISNKLGIDFSDNPAGANRKQILIEKILEHQDKTREGES